ncbi:hypothetical protein CCOS865_02106 [Pseudomonas reidholzensis]|uniref:Uncharacterized protein n=1 Tax=Pseudomonas reidholzensis TaxID=1785162 RepID=A0A383RT74_9PSED|nr:hypothetical protein [Pseudomonas reidholzensis]SYX89844.1 hypothetical protein CCOS865_02106 [Pseudomonas reidholzensis]
MRVKVVNVVGLAVVLLLGVLSALVAVIWDVSAPDLSNASVSAWVQVIGSPLVILVAFMIGRNTRSAR